MMNAQFSVDPFENGTVAGGIGERQMQQRKTAGAATHFTTPTGWLRAYSTASETVTN